MRQPNDNRDFPRWYHVVAFAVILMVFGYALQACAGLVTPTRAAGQGYNVKATAPLPGARPIFGDWYHVAATTDKATLAALPDVLAVEDDPVAVIQADPLQASQYQLARIGTSRAWATATGAGVTIAILDTGVNCGHEDLRGHCTGDADDHGHGTHVAGIAAATAGNGLGGAGVAYGASILSVKVLDARGSGSFSAIAAGLTKAADAGAQVANMSLGCVGSQCASQMMQEAVAYARDKGVVVVAAAGNHGTSAPSYPGLYALSVAATDRSDRLASFSAYGEWVDVSAPGDGITSTLRDGTYGQMSGTSMATPVVAGVAALVRQACPGCTVSQVEDRLRNGDPVDTPRLVGRRVNAWRAVEAGAPPSPTRTPAPVQPTVTPRPGTADWGQQVVALVNAERGKAGLLALAWDDRLARAAQAHNEAMDACAKGLALALSPTVQEGVADCFTHILPGEPAPDARARAQGWNGRYILEDIGYGYTSPAAVVAGWMNSPAHRAAILDANATEAGAHYLDGSGDGSWQGLWWTLDIGVGGTVAKPTPTATPRGPLPPAGWVMRVEARPSAGWAVWDALYAFCNRVGVTCSWYRSP